MKYTMIGLTLFLLTTLTWAGTFKDDFSRESMNEWTQVGNGNWKIANGEVVLEVLDCSSVLGLTIGETMYQNYTANVRMKIKTMVHNPGFGVSAGIGLRYNPAASGGYVFGLGMDPWTKAKQAEAIVGKNFRWLHIEPKPYLDFGKLKLRCSARLIFSVGGSPR